MKKIKDQIFEEINPVKLIQRTVKDAACRSNLIKTLLSTKEVFHVEEKYEDSVMNFQPSLLLKDYEDFYKSLTPDNTPLEDYSDMKDGYNVSELFIQTLRFKVTTDYLRYIKNTENGFIVNIYDGESSTILGNVGKITKCEEERIKFNKGEIPECDLINPSNIIYTELEDKAYYDKLFIDSCRNRVVALVINIPFEYFSTQNIKGNIFTYKLNDGTYAVGKYNIDEINEIISTIAANGFDEPLVFRATHGCIIPSDDETAVKLFIATYLGLPSIPAVLYMSNEECMKNVVYEELHALVHTKKYMSRQSIEIINKILKPYIYFEIVGNDIGYFKVGDDYYNKDQYPAINDISDESREIDDRYLDTSIEAKAVDIPMSEEEIQKKIDNRNNELMDELQKKLKREEEEIARKILAGEFG